jgi:hypothetical protein
MLRMHSERIGDAWMHEPETRGAGACPEFHSGGAVELKGVLQILKRTRRRWTTSI